MVRKRKPARVVHPGKILREELIARSWHSVLFSEKLQLGVVTLSLIMSGDKDITPEIADKLAAGLGTSSELWMNLQKQWDER